MASTIYTIYTITFHGFREDELLGIGLQCPDTLSVSGRNADFAYEICKPLKQNGVHRVVEIAGTTQSNDVRVMAIKSVLLQICPDNTDFQYKGLEAI